VQDRKAAGVLPGKKVYFDPSRQHWGLGRKGQVSRDSVLHGVYVGDWNNLYFDSSNVK